LYDELFAAWKQEVKNGQLGSLPSDFYSRTAKYLHDLKADNKAQDAKSVRSILLEHELTNVTRMVQELVILRYLKMLKLIAVGKKVPSDKLAAEELGFYSGVSPSAEAFSTFQHSLLEGHLVPINVETAPVQNVAPSAALRRVTVRFLKPVPSIMGSDMKSYGPFLAEDVGSVPSENAKILVKQGLARVVEISP
jgi:DNA replication initiation complex subunit (GINS family)